MDVSLGMSAAPKVAHRTTAGMLLSALRSTAVIAAVVFVAIEFRFGRFRLADVNVLLSDHWGFLVVVFLVLLIWDIWFRRTRDTGFDSATDRDP
jgi:hypothetical protein